MRLVFWAQAWLAKEPLAKAMEDDDLIVRLKSVKTILARDGNLASRRSTSTIHAVSDLNETEVARPFV